MKRLVFEQIHMGQRLQHFVSIAPHGKGALAVAKLLNIGKTTIYNAYQRPSLDMVEVEKVCEFYGITIYDFLGIKPENMPNSFKIRTTEKVQEFELINSKLDKILMKLN